MANEVRRWVRWPAMTVGTVAVFVLVWGALSVAELGLDVSLSLAGLASAPAWTTRQGRWS